MEPLPTPASISSGHCVMGKEVTGTTIPGFTAGASLYRTSEHYRSAGMGTMGQVDPLLALQLCRHLGQFCGGIVLLCCPGLRCTAGVGGRGICVPNLFHCSPCIPRRQFCCPPPVLAYPVLSGAA